MERRLGQRFDAEFNHDGHPMSKAELRAAFASAEAVLPTGTDRIDAEVLGGEGRAPI